MADHEEPKKLSASEAAKRLEVSTQTIRNRIRDGKLAGCSETDPETGAVRYYVDADALEDNGDEKLKAESEDIIRRYTDTIVEEIQNLKESQNLMVEQAIANQKQSLDNQQEQLELLQKILDELRSDEGLG